ncbi:glycosyltransferase [Pedobacter frigidisoli]|uniref:Glycosyltransferase n=1 Tax=Pedobacter frigidisoli TaxID=2530455 RepID=A0A4R0P3G4_9SPHI|nr:glycosyltransferase family 4 protein [Pedobacter frigidisoli]TCD07714.1 glycosyltransferase [Pedobacter frigidisoli]
MKRIAVIVTHPIQYYSPVFKLLADHEYVTLKVFYTLGQSNVIDLGFNQKIEWDIPLLNGYDHEFLINSSKVAGSHHYKGVVNPQIIDRIEAFDPNIIMVYGWSYESHWKTMKYFNGTVPIWFRGDSTLIDEQSYLKKMARKIILSIVYRKINKAFYVGQQNKDYFSSYGLKSTQLVHAPHAVDNNRFSEDRSKETEHLRVSLGLGDQDILILFAGKLESKKNPLLLLSAFLKIDQSNLHLLFVGNGVLEESLKSLAKNNESKKVHFLDFQNQTQMPVVYQACDLFCLPSKGPAETWGLAVNEAMAAGRAILVSHRVGCGIDLVEDGRNGYTFESENELDLINKIELLYADKYLLTEMGRNSYEKIRPWSFENQVKSIISELEKI